MTVENRRLISLDEIAALSITCPKCRGDISIPFSNEAKFPKSCPLCEDEWTIRDRSDWRDSNLQDIEALRTLIARMQGGLKASYEFRLQLRREEE